MRVCLMIEGQEGVSWDQWLALAEACERGGFEALFRSDHYLSVRGRSDLGSLDAWATLAGLAARTERLRLGTLVSPVTFRHPSVVAKNAVTVDQISGGRVELGLGAGWYEGEHDAYGFRFPSTSTRLEMLDEQLQIVMGQWSQEPFSFEGRHYRVQQLYARPRPVQEPHPPLIVGGSGGPRSMQLAATWATEYNTLLADVAECRARRERLERAWEQAGRDPKTVRLSLMATCVVGADEADVRRRLARLAEWRGRSEDPEELLERSASRSVIGTPEQVTEHLEELEDAGVGRVMLQHLLHDDVEMVELIGKQVLPSLAR